MRSALSVLVIGLIVTGCSSTLEPRFVEGKWNQQFQIPGNSFQMSLTSHGSRIEGTGFGCGEAGPCRDATITGTADAAGVHLDIVSAIVGPTPRQLSQSHFEGQLYTKNVLSGTLTATGAGDEIGAKDRVTFARASDRSPLD